MNQKLFQNAHTPVALLPAPPPAPPPPPPPPHDGEATPEDAAAAFKGPWCCNQNAMHGRLPRRWAGAGKNRCPLPCTVSTRPRAALETPTWLESAAARLCDANSRRRHLVLQCRRLVVYWGKNVSGSDYCPNSAYDYHVARFSSMDSGCPAKMQRRHVCGI